MFSAYIQWWDRHPWMVLVIFAVVLVALEWERRKGKGA